MACFLRNKKGFTQHHFYPCERKSGAGFTLIEITIAIFVLSLGIFGTLSMFAYGIKVMKNSQLVTVANQLAEEKIEETISKNYDEIAVGTPSETPLASPFNAFRRETRITYVDPGANLQEVASDKEAKKIEVTVFWKSLFGLGDKNIKITTLIGKR